MFAGKTRGRNRKLLREGEGGLSKYKHWNWGKDRQVPLKWLGKRGGGGGEHRKGPW